MQLCRDTHLKMGCQTLRSEADTCNGAKKGSFFSDDTYQGNWEYLQLKLISLSILWIKQETGPTALMKKLQGHQIQTTEVIGAGEIESRPLIFDALPS